MNINIQYYKWNKKDFITLKNSCFNKLDLREGQIYQPYFSLYFYIHNTQNSHQIFDLKRRFMLKEILDCNNEKYYTSNSFLECNVYDLKNNHLFKNEVFCKSIPLLDPINFMMNNYNNIIHRNPLLPSCYNYNTSNKINNMCNTAYIDTFFSYICSELTLNNINPSFPIFYGSINGIKEEFNYDISEDYDDFKREEWFHKNIKKGIFSIDMYMSDSEDSESSTDESSVSSTYSSNDDYIAILRNIPCQNFFIEKLEGTLEDLLDEDLDICLLKSCIFQISFALSHLQKHYSFTHNDLHVNNIMFKKTDKDFLYYKFNNIYYKVPTHGYAFKIIDFGRCIFTFHKKTFFNDTFDKHGEAEGQYTTPYNNLLINNKDNGKDKDKEIIPNYNFDLCRLAITILDVIDFDKNKDYKENQIFINFIYNMTCGRDGTSLYYLNDDFSMYISIAKKAEFALPKFIIQNIIFNDYRIKKKKFPKKSYYTL